MKNPCANSKAFFVWYFNIIEIVCLEAYLIIIIETRPYLKSFVIENYFASYRFSVMTLQFDNNTQYIIV